MKKLHHIIFIFSISILSLVLAGTDGTIRGKVTDTDGNPLPGAQIFIKELQMGAIAGSDGSYILLNIPIGNYGVTVTMMGYRKETRQNVHVIMDQTVWLNFTLPIAAIEGEEIEVIAERPLMDPGSTAKKITISDESIEALPIRDVSELYSLQSGVVQVHSRKQAIPDHEERGLEEVHVRGGRSGETAYMIDGMYIRNPIFGGIGTGTQLNLFAIRELDWQPGGFNAEYGDAMSAVSNIHTKSGGEKFSYSFKYETSMLGAAMGSEYDDLRGANDYSLGFGGSFPGYQKLRYWVSGQYSDHKSYSVYEYDDISFIENDPGNVTNYENLVHPFDKKAGFRGFGFENTWDIFGKLSYNPTNKLRVNVSYWSLSDHRKIFNPSTFLYWNLGQNELFRDTQRFFLEFNHQLTSRTFYTARISRFAQGSFSGVRLRDSDDDGYPDWFEWGHSAGERDFSDPYNPDVIPYTTSNDTVFYTRRDGEGPGNWTSGWYYGAEPGNYNWSVAEEFNDNNFNGIWDEGEGFTDANGNDVWDGPILTEKSIYRDGDHWLTPEMYIDHKLFYDNSVFTDDWFQDPYLAGHFDEYFGPGGWFFENRDSLYFMGWNEGQSFGGHDRFFNTSLAVTNEFRFDMTSQVTNKLKVRSGFDYKSHKLNYFDVENPWMDVSANRQRFAEQWNDFGLDGIDRLDPLNPLPNSQADQGEGNGVWDGGIGESFTDRNGNGVWDDAEPLITDPDSNGVWNSGEDYYDLNINGEWDGPELFSDLNGNGIFEPGESFSDFNGNGQWDDYVEPEEVSAYLQTTFEVPWMIINAGIRMDAVNYNSKVWGDPLGNDSPGMPWVFGDFGSDGIEGGVYSRSEWMNAVREQGFVDNFADTAVWKSNWEILIRENVLNYPDDDEIILKPDYGNGEGNNTLDAGEPYSDDVGDYESVIFNDSKWFYKVSPRIGISHIITENITFVFNYGLYYQTPVYSMVFLNTNRQENPNELFQHTQGQIGNATMNAARTQSYEFGFNAQSGRRWGFSMMVWAKDMDQLSTAQTHRSSVYTYQIASNGDYGTSRGIDFTLENRGRFANTLVQYTYSKAKANGEYDKSAFGEVWVDAPSQQYLMYYDRPHDFTISVYTNKLPFGVGAGLTGFYQSGYPYTPMIFNGDKPQSDVKNKNTKRAPAFKMVNLSLSKLFKYYDIKVTLGVNVYNVFDLRIPVDVFDLTGEPDDPGEYYTENVGTEVSGSYYNFPWYYTSPRQINLTARFDFR